MGAIAGGHSRYWKRLSGPSIFLISVRNRILVHSDASKVDDLAYLPPMAHREPLQNTEDLKAAIVRLTEQSAQLREAARRNTDEADRLSEQIATLRRELDRRGKGS